MSKLSSLCEKYLFWWVVVLSVFIPLYPKFPLVNIPGTYVAIRAEDFLIAIGSILWFIATISHIRQFLSQYFTQTFLLFWGIGTLSLFSGIYLTQTVTPHIGTLHLLRRIEVMLLFFLALAAFKNINQVKLWLKITLVTTLVIVLYGFGQQWFSFPVVSTTNKEFSKGLILSLTPGARINSTFAGHYDLAAFMAIFLPIAVSMIFYLKFLFSRIIIVMASALSFLTLALTAARISFLAAFIGIASALVLVGQKRLILVLLSISVIVFIISPDLRERTIATITVNLLGSSSERYVPPPQKENPDKAFSIENAATGVATPSGVPRDIAPGEPLDTTELGVYRSFGIRWNEEWPRAVRAFFKNPFLGTGYSSITIATDNDYLRSLGETGLLGTLSFGLIWFLIIRMLWLFIRRKTKDFSFYFVVGVFSGVVAMAINATFIDVLESSKVASILWITLGIAIALINFESKNESI